MTAPGPGTPLASTHRNDSVWNGLGISSFVLTTLGFVLFFMPVFGLLVSGAGFLLGVLGCVSAGRLRSSSVRWAVGGIAVGIVAIVTNLGMQLAPGRFAERREMPAIRRTTSGRPISPPSLWMPY